MCCFICLGLISRALKRLFLFLIIPLPPAPAPDLGERICGPLHSTVTRNPALIAETGLISMELEFYVQAAKNSLPFPCVS